MNILRHMHDDADIEKLFPKLEDWVQGLVEGWGVSIEVRNTAAAA